MRKKFLTLAAATFMSMAMTVSAFAAVPDDYTGYYTFDETLDNGAKDGKAAEVTGAKVVGEAPADAAAKYADGVTGKALSMDGTYGLKLGKLLTGNQYTVSYDVKVHKATFGTAGVFIESMNGSASTEKWEGVKPVRDNDSFDTAAPQIWANTPDGNRYELPASVHAEGVKQDNWYKVTFVKDDKMGTLYVDGEIVAKGWVQNSKANNDTSKYQLPYDTVNGDTIVWLGVNYWDVPLNADVDNLYIYDRALKDDELKELIGTDIKDSVGTIEEPELVEKPAELKPQLGDKNAFLDSSNADEEESDNTMMYVIIAVVVVVVVVVVIAVVASSKKKSADDDDDEE